MSASDTVWREVCAAEITQRPQSRGALLLYTPDKRRVFFVETISAKCLRRLLAAFDHLRCEHLLITIQVICELFA